jgi:hypothetical protein
MEMDARVVIAIVAALCLDGCRVDRVPRDIAGRYLADYAQATEELSLLDSHTFHQVVRMRTGRTLEASGKWTFDRDSGDVVFEEGFIVVVDGFGRLRPNLDSPESGAVVYPARWGVLGRYIGSDEGVLYRRE